MADSEALRARRYRAHRAGSHDLCKPDCAARKLSAAASRTIAGEVTDPASELRQLAYRMAQAHRDDPGNAILGAELRKTLLELMPKGKRDVDDDLSGLYAALQA